MNVKKNTANYITIFRIILVPIFVAVLQINQTWSNIAAFIIFVIASISDSVDGYIARRYNQVSNFGKIVDPLADKLLVMSALLVFVQIGRMNTWVALIILAREFAVTSLRVVAVAEGIVMPAAISGKIKTVVHMVGICILLTQFSEIVWVRITVSVAMVLVTLWSGIDYFVKNKGIFTKNSD